MQLHGIFVSNYACIAIVFIINKKGTTFTRIFKCVHGKDTILSLNNNFLPGIPTAVGYFSSNTVAMP